MKEKIVRSKLVTVVIILYQTGFKKLQSGRCVEWPGSWKECVLQA